MSEQVTSDPRFSALCTAVAQLIDGYAEVARLLPAWGAPQDAQEALLAPLREAADHATAVLEAAAA